MEKTMEYEEPKLVELAALPMRGDMGIKDDGTTENVSDLDWRASYDGDDAEHEIVEF